MNRILTTGAYCAALLFCLLLASSVFAQNLSWQATAEFPEPRPTGILELAAAPSGKILAGSSDQGLFVSTNRGDSWQHIDLPAETVFTLAIGANGLIYAGTFQEGLFRSSDDGTTWKPTSFSKDLHLTCVALAPDGVVYAGARHEGRGVYRSVDNGDNWQYWSAGLAKEADVVALGVDAEGRAFAGSSSQGLYRFDQSTGRWRSLRKQINLSNVRSLAFAGSGLSYAAGDGGIFSSTDHGDSWRQLNLDRDGSPVYYDVLTLGLAPNGVIYASSVWEKLLLSRDGGKSWLAAAEGLDLSNAASRALAVAADGTVYVRGGGTTVYRAEGATRTGVNEAPPATGTVSSVALAPNPFTTKVKIEFFLTGPASLSIFNSRGAKVFDRDKSSFRRGINTLVWKGRDRRGRLLPAGAYYCVLASESAPNIVWPVILRR